MIELANTFAEWQSSRKWTDDLSATTGMDHETYPAGFVYRDDSHVEAREWGFGVVIGTTESEFATIEDAEAFLWKEWSEGEVG